MDSSFGVSNFPIEFFYNIGVSGVNVRLEGTERVVVEGVEVGVPRPGGQVLVVVQSKHPLPVVRAKRSARLRRFLIISK